MLSVMSGYSCSALDGQTQASGGINGLVQERRNSSALALELRLSCTNPSACVSIDCARTGLGNSILVMASGLIVTKSLPDSMLIYHQWAKNGIKVKKKMFHKNAAENIISEISPILCPIILLIKPLFLWDYCVSLLLSKFMGSDSALFCIYMW